MGCVEIRSAPAGGGFEYKNSILRLEGSEDSPAGTTKNRAMRRQDHGNWAPKRLDKVTGYKVARDDPMYGGIDCISKRVYHGAWDLICDPHGFTLSAHSQWVFKAVHGGD